MNIANRYSLPSNIREVKIHAKYDGVDKHSEYRGLNDLNYNQVFNFKMLSLDKEITIEICDQRNVLGEAHIPLRQISNQEDIDLALNICDVSDKENLLFVLNLKLTVIASFFKLYELKYLKSEREIERLNGSLIKLYGVLDNLNGKFYTNFIQIFITN